MSNNVVDSKAWVHINSTWLKFAQEPHNLKLGLALDRVNPFGNQSNTWSTWSALILNYNFPPLLTIKKLFLMLALLIPGKESVKNINIYLYLVPLLDEFANILEEGLCLGHDKARGVEKVQTARFAYVGNS